MPFQPRQYPLVPMPQVDPMRGLSELMYAARSMQAYEDDRQARQDQQALDRAMHEADGDYSKAAERLGKQGRWRLAKPLHERAEAQIQHQRQQKEQEFGQMLQRAERLPSMYGKADQLLGEITTPEQYASALPTLREWATSIHPDLAAKIPETYEPTQVAEWRRSLPVLQGKATRFAEGLRQFLPGNDPMKGLAVLYETAETDEEREQITAQAKYFDVPQGTITAALGLAASTRAAAEKAKRTEDRAERPNTIEEALLDPTLTSAREKELTTLAEGLAGARRAPQAPESRFWVMRDGKPLRITEAQYRPGDLPASTREQGRPVVSGDANRIADFDTSLDDLTVLHEAVSGNRATGTAAKVGAMLPNWATELTGWGTEAKSKQAVIDRVKQVIGKALEGGVLRKEDEYKYEKILPTIGDVQDVVAAKLVGLEDAITRRRQTLIESLGDAGYDVTKYQARPPRQRSTAGDISEGETVTYDGKRYKVKSVTNSEAELEPIP